MSLRQREGRKAGGGKGGGEVGKEVRVAGADGTQLREERTVECHAVDDVLIGILEEEGGDGSLGPRIDTMFEGVLVVEVTVRDMAPENGPEAASGERMATDKESVCDASIKEALWKDVVLAEECEAVTAATVDNLDDGRVGEPRAQRGVGSREKSGNLADVEDMSVVRRGRVGIGGRCSGDTDLEELNGTTTQSKPALEIEGDDAGIAGLAQDSGEGVKGGEGNLG